MTNPWFKFYAGEYLSDTKILQLDAQERSCWVTLLCLSNQGDGKVKFLSENQLLIMSGVTNSLPNVLKKFETLGMITISNGIVTLKNWKKRQYSEGYSRVKKFRDKKSNAKDNDREEESREDKRRIDIELPLWLNKNAWNAWVKFRKELGKSLKPSTIKFQLKLLEKNIEDHPDIIRNSITNGWTGLFPITKGKNSSKRFTDSRNLAQKNEDDKEIKISKQDQEKRKELLGQSNLLADKFSIKE